MYREDKKEGVSISTVKKKSNRWGESKLKYAGKSVLGCSYKDTDIE
jgi:hypothetical protein